MANGSLGQVVRTGERRGTRPKPGFLFLGRADYDVGRIVAMTQESKAPDVELMSKVSKRHIVKRKILFQ